MTYDEIELNALSSLDALNVAAIRPQLFAPPFSTAALRDDELREKLLRDVEQNAARKANFRARLLFEKNELSPASSRRFELEEELRELDEELARERLRAQWLELSATKAGRQTLLEIEEAPLHSLQTPRHEARITLGLQRGFGGPTHSMGEVEKFVQDYLTTNGHLWSVAISATRLVYSSSKSAGIEDGAEIGLINDPRFPASPDDFRARALELALALREKFGQERLCLVLTNEILMLEAPNASTAFDVPTTAETRRPQRASENIPD